MTPKLRKKCKLCRWKSCLEAGMSFGSMKMGRIPKRDLERVEDSSQESMDVSNNSNPKRSIKQALFKSRHIKKHRILRSNSEGSTSESENVLDRENVRPR